METLDFESDRFLQLLTDALRAGPGSPEWHDAVEALRTNGTGHGDEYQLLITARENLEKGKEFRSVRAGAGFTRKLNQSLDNNASTKRPPTTGIVAFVSAGMILAVAAVVLYLLFPSGAPTAAIDKLSSTYFVEPILERSFDTVIEPDFARIGSAAVVAVHGLHPIRIFQMKSPMGGGVVWLPQLDPDQPIAIDATLRVARPSDDTIAEFFVADNDDFSVDKGTSRSELLWLYQAGQAKVVVPGGEVKKQTTLGTNFKGTLTIRIVLDRDAAIVSQQSKPIWSGAHGLDANKPRRVGLRFIQTAPDGETDPAMSFTSIKILKP